MAEQGQGDVRGGQHQQNRDNGLQCRHGDHGLPLIPAVHEHTSQRAHHDLWEGGRQDEATDGQWCPGLARDQEGGHPEHERGIPGIVSHTGDGLPPPEQGEVRNDEGRPGEVLQPPAQRCGEGRGLQWRGWGRAPHERANGPERKTHGRSGGQVGESAAGRLTGVPSLLFG